MARSMHGDMIIVCKAEDNHTGVKVYDDGAIGFWCNGAGHMHLSQMWNSKMGGGNIMLTPMQTTSHEGAKVNGRPHADSIVVAEANDPRIGSVKVRVYADGCYRLAFSKSDHYYSIEGFWFDDDGGNVMLALGNVPVPEDKPELKSLTSAFRWEVPIDRWVDTRDTIAARLVEWARAGQIKPYTDLIEGLDHITDPHSHALAEMLGEIQALCHAADSPLLPAIVTYKHDPTHPAKGFFEKARSLGYQIDNNQTAEDAFWVAQVGAVFKLHR